MADSDEDYIEEYSDDEYKVASTYGTRSGKQQQQQQQPKAASASQNASTSAHVSASASASKFKSTPTPTLTPTSKRKPGRKHGGHSRAAWEDVKRSWETVVEGADGSLAAAEWQLEADKRRRLLRDTTPLQRGIIRHLILVLDMSFAMADKDMLPHRHNRAAALAIEFVREYFDQNPISQLGIIGMREGVAVRVSESGGNPEEHIARLRQWQKEEPRGNPSLQNALEMCRGVLFHAPAHGTREVLIVYGALLSSDPGNIHTTLDSLVSDRIRVSMIGLSAHLAICAELCTKTNAGDASTYRVAIDEVHLRELLFAATTPPITRDDEHSIPSMLMMGFPSRALASGGGPTFCACHNTTCREGYPCTRCGAKVCKLPAVCPACDMTLILSTHLARSFHHLFPLLNWAEVSWRQARSSKACFSCHAPFPDAPSRGDGQQQAQQAQPGEDTPKLESHAPRRQQQQQQQQQQHQHQQHAKINESRPRKGDGRKDVKGISESSRYACIVCKKHYCIDCDVYAHEVLHNCPGCHNTGQDAVEDGTAGVVNGYNTGDKMLVD